MMNFNVLFFSPYLVIVIVSADPTEKINLAKSDASMVELEALFKRLMSFVPKMIPADYPEIDKSGHPSHFNVTWSPGWCNAI